jgi:hypothetical protein
MYHLQCSRASTSIVLVGNRGLAGVCSRENLGTLWQAWRTPREKIYCYQLRSSSTSRRVGGGIITGCITANDELYWRKPCAPTILSRGKPCRVPGNKTQAAAATPKNETLDWNLARD